MTKQDIKTIINLCDYINESEEFPVDIETIISEHNWASFNGYSKYPDYICTDGNWLLLKSQNGVEAQNVDAEFIEEIIDEMMESSMISSYENELQVFRGLYNLQVRNLRKSLGNRIAELRAVKNMKQNELADAAGINRTNIVKIENGRYNVSLDILSKIATALKCRLDILTLEESDELIKLRMTLKAERVFRYYNARCKDINIFGDWAVNSCGDIVNYTKGYPIYDYNLAPYNYSKEQALTYWYDHLSEKRDFDVDNFVKAFSCAWNLAISDE